MREETDPFEYVVKVTAGHVNNHFFIYRMSSSSRRKR